MTILVTGSTGTIGSQVIAKLAGRGADIRALTRSPEKAQFPQGVTAVKGDLMDIDAMRAALQGVSSLFLLVPNGADELTQAINTLNLAREAGVRGIVYLSVTRSDVYTDVPHFTAKHAAERMIEQLDLPATILRPSYFFQNDLTLKGPLVGAGLYVSPIGGKGVSMVDTGDIADAAANELLRRALADKPLPREIYELVGPDSLDGTTLADIWTAALSRPVHYLGDDLDAFEKQLKTVAPSWKAYDLRLMMRRYQQDGAAGSTGDIQRLTALLGRAPRSYRDFAIETARNWQS